MLNLFYRCYNVMSNFSITLMIMRRVVIIVDTCCVCVMLALTASCGQCDSDHLPLLRRCCWVECGATRCNISCGRNGTRWPPTQVWSSIFSLLHLSTASADCILLSRFCLTSVNLLSLTAILTSIEYRYYFLGMMY